jgi:hypothetical protein
MFPRPKTLAESVLHLYQNYPAPAKVAAKTTLCPQTLERFAAGRAAVFPLPALDSCHATSIGAAIAIDEYVPIRIPTTSANENPLKTGPPYTNSESTVRNVSPDVSTVRLSV